MELAGGSLIFLAFLIAYFFAVAYGLYSKRGSGISQRPYRGDRSDLSHDRIAAQQLTRGTRA